MDCDKISIILPVRNQADHIVEIVEQYIKAIDFIATEFFLIVNGSTDHSIWQCHALSQRYSNIHIRGFKERGFGLAVKHGLKYAKGNYLCYTNSARTSAEDLKKAIKYAITNDAVIKTSRRLKEKFLRTLGSMVYNLECRLLFDLYYSDVNGTPKIWPRKFNKLMNLQSEDSLIDLEFCIICQKEKYPVLEMPTFAVKRHGGKSSTTMALGLNLLWKTFWDRKKLRGV